ncbi:hypothetical protein DdX_08232 [Ditylenchus destructor]|uniref:SWIM-type domain-containing protein n=1 Tax=Ditylenchus destructor TaxID=166010 RepID=A0AAD4R7E0_9BILA|nr:hypothetical protein DdX_08232 [Ditylenchus destructor]
MTDRRVDFTETESEDSSNEENVEPAENSHASSGLEGSFQLVPRRSENEQAEHDLVQDVSQERGRKVGSKNDEYDIAEEFENLSDFKQWFADKQDKWTNAPECQSWIAAYVAGTNLDAYLTNWNDYKDTRFKYHAVKAREREAFLCTCQIGIKKELCKHILLVKHEKGEFRWPEEFAALPLNTKFTGRPRKRQLVTRYQGN